MNKAGVNKWIIKVIRDRMFDERLRMTRKKLNYGIILNIIRMLKERGMTDQTITNILDLYEESN